MKRVDRSEQRDHSRGWLLLDECGIFPENSKKHVSLHDLLLQLYDATYRGALIKD